tara:strand:- start:382 stop:609 length:228 start_codon:yes stop_codon:yes gene_type:complete
MILKIKILSATFLSAFVLLITLCLGSQNLRDRYSINIGITEVAPLPVGFISGIALISGIISGGSIAALSVKKNKD